MGALEPDEDAGRVEQDRIDDADADGGDGIAVVVLLAPIVASRIEVDHGGREDVALQHGQLWTALDRLLILG